MLKLPSLRGELQIRLPRSESLKNLCEAYDEAAAVLQNLRTDSRSGVQIKEYEAICEEIESDVIEYLVNETSVRK